LRFRYFIDGSLSFISSTLTCLVFQGFSPTVHNLGFTTSAARGGLTTPPDTALSVDLPPSFKELHGTSRGTGGVEHMYILKNISELLWYSSAHFSSCLSSAVKKKIAEELS
jgi:hypothetical protein